MKINYLLSIVIISILVACNNEQESTVLTVQKWHTLTLSFEGEQTSESDANNPFINYLLIVDFQQNETKKTIRGFYAADGNAAESSAEAGAVWQVRFSPDIIGEWTYSASLYKGDSIALKSDYTSGEKIAIENSKGSFNVVPSTATGNDFKAKGRVLAHNGYFKYQDTDEYFLKAGADSPENFLAYTGFDNTYRVTAASRDGEAKTNETIHSYQPHLQDWQEGDPTWKNGKGKEIIGSINYLASKNMNVIYFLTFNVQGDGNDVWMYLEPNDFTRFDVSKLEQWEIVFQHMQSKGIMLHVVLQETENETLLDNGDVGPMRALYYQELIARFGHHLALVWNLGEENGPTPWAPDKPGQNDAQRKAGAKFLKDNDPYKNAVVLHTLPNEEHRVETINDILGYKYLDGISLQHSDRYTAAQAVANLKEKSKDTGHHWLVAMDEIGMWHTGAKADTADLNHPTLTRKVLWGTLLSGAAGIEWYFGARSAHNDLNSEDWRQRDRLWEITDNAKTFFNNNLPYWDMTANHGLVSADSAYCLYKENEVYALYVPEYAKATLDLSNTSGNFQVKWYAPFEGGSLKDGSVQVLEGGKIQDLGEPPSKVGEDWVVLVKKES